MDENQTTNTIPENDGFDDFAAAFDDDSGYQTESDTEEVQAEEGNSDQEAAEPAESDDAEVSEEDAKPEEKAEQESPSAPEKPASEQMHTIKHNKETKEVTYDELISHAQMGMDYPRVKEQRDQARQEVQALQSQIDQNKEILGMVDMLAKSSKLPPGEIMDHLYISLQKSRGIDEATAREALRADKLQRQVSEMEESARQQQAAQEDKANRAQREIEEFRKSFPDVALTEADVDRLTPDVQNGMTLSDAYRKDLMAKKDAEIAELQRQLAAEKQNKKNRAASPGSQVDSGGKRTRSDYDDFVSALFD